MRIVEHETRSLSNAARRTLLCGQHQSLRKLIDATKRAAIAALANREQAMKLVANIAALEAELAVHLETEEALLEPILAGIDAWGPVRLERLQAEHRRHRAFFVTLAGRSPGIQTVARRTISFCAELLEDMALEDRELLVEDVLRDDCVAVDAADA